MNVIYYKTARLEEGHLREVRTEKIPCKSAPKYFHVSSQSFSSVIINTIVGRSQNFGREFYLSIRYLGSEWN
jgi:hypothetical protein